MTLKVKKFEDNATVPSKGSSGAAGYDLYSNDTHVIMPWTRAVIPTGIGVKLPDGVYGRIAPRSGLSVKNGINVGAGVVDPDYTGELKVVLFNHDNNPFIIKPGYRIAQLVLEKFDSHDIEVVNELDSTERGEGGFGSTGS